VSTDRYSAMISLIQYMRIVGVNRRQEDGRVVGRWVPSRIHASQTSVNDLEEEDEKEKKKHEEEAAATLPKEVPVLEFVRCELHEDEEEIDRLERHLKRVGACIESREDYEGRLVVNPETTLSALPSSYLKDVIRQIRGFNIKPLQRQKISGADNVKAEGSGEEILLQGFHWDSWKQDGGWYGTLGEQAEAIADAGFTMIWLPPPTESVSPQGYMPRDLYHLESKYGSQEDLIDLIRVFQSKGIKVLGDAVLNHRCAHEQNEQGVWNQFGGRMDWDARAIVRDDPNFHGRGNFSSGDVFTAAPNIDHSQEFVKNDVGEWLVWLRTNIGFDGWRLDFVKGFHGSHVKDYLEVSKPLFSVGEYWDALEYEWDGTPKLNQDAHRQRTVDWINAAGGLSTAFDITTKGILHAVFERCEYWRLSDAQGHPPGLVGWWPSRAVTFLENHDTGSTQGHWRFPHHALEQGYAYILTHPGTPCVFYDHMFHDEHLSHVIKRLIALRKELGIHCRSTITILQATNDVYAARIDDALVVKLGPGDFHPRDEECHIADRGHAWAVWRLS